MSDGPRNDYLRTELPKFKWFAEQIATKGHGNRRILDVGFSQAPNPYLAGDVTGLDCVDCAKPVNYKEIVLWNIDSLPLPFADGAYDVVILGDVIEHVRRPFELLRDTHRLLADGGMLLVSTPNPHYLPEVLKTWLGVYHPDDPEHLTHFPYPNLRQYLEELGYRIQEAKWFKCWIPTTKWFWLRVGVSPMLGYQYMLRAKKLH